MPEDKYLEGKLFISGEWLETSQTFEVKQPAGGDLIAKTYWAGPQEIEKALASAVAGGNRMRGLARFQIADGLENIARSIEGRKIQFANIISRESAKPLIYSRAEVERAIHTFRYAGEEAKRFAGEVVPVDTQAAGRGKTAYTERIPRGAILGITPFNFPLNLVAHKVAPALASGNSILVKPSPRTPLTAIMLAEAFEESGLPKEAMQVVNIRNEDIGGPACDIRINMISFTGSAEIGWKLKRMAARTHASLELGGNAPVIIDETSDWRKTIDPGLVAAYAFSGQICISAQRFYLHEKIFEDWVAAFAEKAGSLRPGDPLDEKTRLSVMIDENAAKRAEEWIREAVAGGAEIVFGGRREGAYLEPTLLTGTTPAMKANSEEIFAPVAIAERFSDFEKAIFLANHGKYGLQCSVFTDSRLRIKKAFAELDFGAVLINDMPVFRVDNMPYGGIKNSGWGREGIRYAMEEMSETKLLIMS